MQKAILWTAFSIHPPSYLSITLFFLKFVSLLLDELVSVTCKWPKLESEPLYLYYVVNRVLILWCHKGSKMWYRRKEGGRLFNPLNVLWYSEKQYIIFSLETEQFYIVSILITIFFAISTKFHLKSWNWFKRNLLGSYPIHDNIAAKMKQRTKIWVH